MMGGMGMHPGMMGMHHGMHPGMMGGMRMGMHPGMMGGMNHQSGSNHNGDEDHSSDDRRRRMLNAKGNQNLVIPESEYKIIEKCRSIGDNDICVTYYYTDQSIAVDVYALG